MLRAYPRSNSYSEVVEAFVALFLAVLLVSVLAKLLVGDKRKAGIAVSALLAILLFYGDFEIWFFRFHLSGLRFRYFGLIAGAVYVLAVLYMVKSQRTFVRFTRYANFVCLVCVPIELLLGMAQHTESLKPADVEREIARLQTLVDHLPTASVRPDVYYIILDSYTSSESLRRFWQFDNADFEKFLADRGFCVASKSRTPYLATGPSIASSLNMSFLGNKKLSAREIFSLIDSSTVAGFFEAQGYKMINLSLFDVRGTPKFYGHDFFAYTESGSFLMYCFKRTLITRLKDELSKSSTFSQINLRIRNQLLTQARSSQHSAEFVYAHFMLPHAPFVFDSTGKVLNVFQMKGARDKSGYLDQVLYANKMIEEIVDTILAKSGGLAVIVIQGDHGSRYLSEEGSGEEAHSIMNAYHMPSNKRVSLSQSTGPANSFRIIINECFGGNLDLLDDHASVPDSLYKLLRY
jgi:hypothetical protein